MTIAATPSRQPYRHRCARSAKWLSACLAVFSLLAGNAVAETTWPRIDLPKELRPFDITGGGTTSVNGLPMRIRGFISGDSREHVATLFRQSLGQPLVETAQGNKLLLGRVQGEYYVMVQLEQAGAVTRGIVSVSHLKAAYEAQMETRAGSERWLAGLPAGTRMLSQMNSEDAGKVSRHLVFQNSSDEELNGGRLKALMQEDGMLLQQETEIDPKAGSKRLFNATGGKSFFFKGEGKEAVAVIYRDASGRTAIVLNIVSQMDRIK